jgi:outer membrane protein assembly factor BamB
VYVGDGSGSFFCLDAATGKKRWEFKTDPENPAEIPSGANFSGDRVLFGCADEKLYCLNAKTGKKEWEFKIDGGPVNATPVVVEGRTFVAGCDSMLHVLDVATGKEIASVDLGGQVAATSGVLGESVYIGTMTNQVLGVNWKKPEVTWTFEPTRARAFYASTAVTDNLVVTGNRNNKVYGIDRKTGKEAWSFTTRGAVDSSPVIVGKRVYVGSMDNNLYVLDLEKGTQIAKHDLGEDVTGSPAVGGGCLVIGNGKGEVFCFE